jgi:leishmanolysin-like peptidase
MQQASNYKNMRIQVVYASSSDATNANWAWIQNTLMPKTVEYLSSMLKVYPVSGKLYVPRTCRSVWTSSTDGLCGGTYSSDSSETCGSDYGTVPAADLGGINIYESTGQYTVDASASKAAGSGGYADKDLIMFVTSKNSNSCGGSTLAYAGGCRYDQYDRTVAGYVNFCPSSIDQSAKEWEQQWSTGVHEIMHALGFSDARFAYFWDHATGNPVTQRAKKTHSNPSGKPSAGDTSDDDAASNDLSYMGSTIRKPSTSTLNSFQERGTTAWKIVSPTALAKARSHFSCSTLNGVELEDEGGTGTKGSHWEQRIYMNEAMTGVSRTQPVLSDITLGYFYDTGWFIVDYTKASALLWGKNAGCDFALNKCLTPGNTPTVVNGGANFFCNDASAKGCNFQGIATGECNVKTNVAPSARNQYWTGSASTGASGSTMNFCPYIKPFSNTDCRWSENAPNQDLYGQTFSTSSRCFVASLVEDGYGIPANANQAACYKFNCTSTALRVWVSCSPTANGCTAQWVTCPVNGGNVEPPAAMGFKSGTHITCPTRASVCDAPFAGFGPPPTAGGGTTTTGGGTTTTGGTTTGGGTTTTGSGTTTGGATAASDTHVIKQTLVFNDLANAAAYTGDTKQVYEVSYAISIGIYKTVAPTGFKANCGVTSSASRRGATVQFSATVTQTEKDAASTAAGTLSDTQFRSAVASANQALSKNVVAPTAGSTTVNQHTVTATSTTSGCSGNRYFGVVALSLLSLVWIGLFN